jgi:ubiquinone/menaquinone biosynthesis C-methylase UbiE
MTTKSAKELAFLYDLYIATDWGERFAELVDEHVKLPKEGRALYVEAGTGGHALALQESGGEKLTIVCADQNKESLELARAKAAALHESITFQQEKPHALSFANDEFDLVLGNLSFTPPGNLRQAVNELARVTKTRGTAACWLPTAGSFGEFFSIYWEALLGAGVEDHGADVERFIADLPAASDVEAWAEEAGLEEVQSWTTIEEFDFESGEAFLNSPLIQHFLLPAWLQSIPKAKRAKVGSELARLIDEERHTADFALSLKATLVVAKKSRVQ